MPDNKSSNSNGASLKFDPMIRRRISALIFSYNGLLATFGMIYTNCEFSKVL